MTAQEEIPAAQVQTLLQEKLNLIDRKNCPALSDQKHADSIYAGRALPIQSRLRYSSAGLSVIPK